jgi:hypothetical protein
VVAEEAEEAEEAAVAAAVLEGGLPMVDRGAVLIGILNACMKPSLRFVNDSQVSPCVLTFANELSDRATQ